MFKIGEIFYIFHTIYPEKFSRKSYHHISYQFNFQFVSRGLGTAIVAGSILVKFPQIIKILSSGDAAGLSFLGVLLELLAVTANGAYSFSQGFPFTAYGEAVFMSFQTSIIAILILW